MKPNSKSEQAALTTFVPDKKIFFGVGVSQYDGVGIGKDEMDKRGKEVVRPAGSQAFHDIPNAGQDNEDMKNCLMKYDFEFFERERLAPECIADPKKYKDYPYKEKFSMKNANCSEQTLFMYNHNCTKNMFNKGLDNLQSIVKVGKKEKKLKKILCVFLFAGHGMIMDGR